MDQQRLDRIRLLSARFNELQGLRVALGGASMAIFSAVYLIFTPQPTNAGAIVAMLLSFVPVTLGWRSLDRYYATTFGRQARSSSQAGAWSLGMYILASWCLNAWIPSLPAGTPSVAVVGAISLFVAIRDWPLRVYYLGAAVAVAIGFAASAPFGGPIPSNLTLSAIFVLLGGSMVPIGLLDHSLLVKLMDEAASVGEQLSSSDQAR